MIFDIVPYKTFFSSPRIFVFNLRAPIDKYWVEKIKIRLIVTLKLKNNKIINVKTSNVISENRIVTDLK